MPKTNYKLATYGVGLEDKVKNNQKKMEEIIAENLKLLRKSTFVEEKIGTTQQKQLISHAINLHSNTYYKMERGSVKFNINVIIRLASLYNMPVSVFFTKGGVANFLGIDSSKIENMLYKKERANKEKALRKDIRLINNRIKQVFFYADEFTAYFMAPTGKIIELQENSCVQLKINNNNSFFIDVLRSAETKKIFFYHSIKNKNIVVVKTLRPLMYLPTSLAADTNAGTAISLTMYIDHMVNIIYHDEPRVVKTGYIHGTALD